MRIGITEIDICDGIPFVISLVEDILYIVGLIALGLKRSTRTILKVHHIHTDCIAIAKTIIIYTRGSDLVN